MKSDDRVPEHEVVELRILSKRSIDDQEVIRVHFSAFGKDINLRLQRNDDLNDKLPSARFYLVTVTDSDVQMKEMPFKDDDPGTPYIDPVQMAAVTIWHASDGVLQMDGVIGDDLLIKPASADINFLADYFDYDGDFIIENGDRITTFGKGGDYENSSTEIRSGVHLVYKSLMKSRISSKVLDDVLNSIDTGDDDVGHRKGPLHAWPQVLLMVDYDTYAIHERHGYNDTQMRRYYISFLNGVDLRFKTLSNPKVSLVLSCVVFFKSLDATPFLEKHLYPNSKMFNGHKAISDLTRYLYSAIMQQDTYPEFDVAVLLTSLDMCTYEFGQCNRNTMGLAYHMGACNINHSREQWMGVAIVEDNGGFDGILTAAHEIAHLLGADHDGTHNYRDDTCSHKDGYIMSHALDSERMFQWSECSIKQFRHFLNLKKSSCLFNQPNNSKDLEKSHLPGFVLSLDEQCKRIWGTRACAWDHRVCLNLRCYTTDDYGDSEYCSYGLTPAAEGSSCGKNLHCRHGHCVPNYLVYNQAWNMAVAQDDRKYRNSLKTTTTKSPLDYAKARPGPCTLRKFKN